jgi:hypothetical protein
MTAQARRGTTRRFPSLTTCIPVLAVVAMGLMPSGVGIALAQNVHLGVDFLTGFPRSEFSNNLGANGYGFAAYGLYGMPRVPLGIGLELGYMNYGSEQRREPLSPTIPDTTVKVRTSNSILTNHLFLRLQPRRGSVRPYADGLIGFKYLYTRTSVRGEGSSEPIAVSTNLDDWALSYGAGGGVQILLYQERAQRSKGRPAHILLDAKLRYIRGSRANYLTRGSIRQENGRVIYDISRSRTDMLVTQLGITFRF